MAGRSALVDYDNEEDSSSEVPEMRRPKSGKNSDLDEASRTTSRKVANDANPSVRPSDESRSSRDGSHKAHNHDTGSGRSVGEERRRNTDRTSYNQERRRSSPRHFDRRADRRDSGTRRDRHDYPSRHDQRRSRSQSPQRNRHTETVRDYPTNRRMDTDDSSRYPNYREKTRNSREFEEKMKRMYPTKQLSQEELSKLPAYINPKSVNVSKVIEQQEKRKLLWQGSKAKKEESGSGADGKAAMWQQATFSGDSDGAVATKFRKLMGLKTETKDGCSSGSISDSGSARLPDAIRNQEELLLNLDRQYEVARLSAHTQRGIGLGFNSR